MLARSTRTAILRLSSEGHSSRAIASLLSVARNSVRSIVKSATDEPPKLNRRSAVDRHRAAIVQLLLDLDGNISKACHALSDGGVEIPYSTLTAFCRRNDLININSNPVLSVNAAWRWLSELPRDARELDRLRARLGADVSSLFSYLKHGRARQRKKAATILARTRGIPNKITAKALHSAAVTTRYYYRLYRELGIMHN